MANEIPDLQSCIESVLVFRHGALVTRRAVLPLDGEVLPRRVRIPGLPLCLDDGSVRVQIAAAGSTDSSSGLPVATEVRVGLDVVPGDAPPAPPDGEELRQARRTEHLLWDRVAVVREAAARLEELQPPPRPKGRPGAPPPPPPSEGRLALLEFRRRELDRLHAEQRTREREHALARERLLALEVRSDLASTEQGPRTHELRKTVIVTLHPPAHGDKPVTGCRLVLEYLVPGASWAPAYALRFDADCTRAWLDLRGLVSQRSGEDWKGVMLTLSTAEALSWADLPELPSLRIGRRQPPPARLGWRAPPAGAEALYADFDAARAALQVPGWAPETTDASEEISALWRGRGEPEGAAGPLFVEPPPTPAPAEADYVIVRARPSCPAQQPLPAAAPCAAPPQSVMASAAPSSYARSEPVPRGRSLLGRRSASLHEERDEFESAVDRGELTAETEQETAATLVARGDLLNYGRLRLLPPDDPRRGRLQPADLLALQQELLVSVQVEVRAEALAQVVAAQQEALTSSSAPLPPGCSRPDDLGIFDHAYRGEQPVEIPADGAFHSVPLLGREAESELRYVVVPRESPEAFRCVSFVNPLPAPLPAGPADIYVGGDYLMTGVLHTVAPGGSAELGLGVEQAVKVARNTRFAERSSGLLGGDLNLEHEIGIEVSNHLPRAARLEVRERIPVPREGDKELSVEVTQVKPPWEDWEQPDPPLRGGHRWQVTVPAGGKVALEAKFVVRLPAKRELQGGNRREG